MPPLIGDSTGAIGWDGSNDAESEAAQSARTVPTMRPPSVATSTQIPTCVFKRAPGQTSKVFLKKVPQNELF